MSTTPKTLDMFIKATQLWDSGWLLSNGQAVMHPPVTSPEDYNNSHISLVLEHPEVYGMTESEAQAIIKAPQKDMALYAWMFEHGHTRFVLQGHKGFFEVPQIDEHYLTAIKDFVLTHNLDIQDVVVDGNLDKQSKEFKMSDILTQLGKAKH